MTDFNFSNEFVIGHILILVALFIVFSILEWKRKKRNRVPRILAVLLALISLYLIYLRPFTSIVKPLKSVVLIGENVSESLSNYIKKFSAYHVLTWDETTHLIQSRNENRSYSFNQLDFAIDTLFVRGYIPTINPSYYQHIIYADTLKPKYDLDFPESVYLGDTITLKVTNNSTETILINGLLMTENFENETIKPGRQFSYEYIPKLSGFIKASIQIDEEENYHFSTYVEDKRKYVVHLLAETPDFEWRFLKDFLADEGHAVYLRSKISINKYKTDFANWPDSLSQQLQTNDPQYADILITDMDAWKYLIVSQKSNYRTNLQANQGVILVRASPNDLLDLSSIQKGLVGQIIVAESINEYEGIKKLNVNKIRDFSTSESLSLNYAILPNLSIGITALQDTYKWQLAGKEELYRDFWIETFNTLLRSPSDNYSDKTKWPVQYQPFHYQLWSDISDDTLVVVSSMSDTLNLVLLEDELYKERQHLVFYPASPGWHQILRNDQTIIDQFYVHPTGASSQNLMNLSYIFNYNHYLERLSSAEEINSSNIKVKSLIIWFFLLFLLSISFLWIEEKI